MNDDAFERRGPDCLCRRVHVLEAIVVNVGLITGGRGRNDLPRFRIPPRHGRCLATGRVVGVLAASVSQHHPVIKQVALIGKKLGAEFRVRPARIAPRDEALAVGAGARIQRINDPRLAIVILKRPGFPDLKTVDPGHPTQVCADVGAEIDHAVVGGRGVAAAQWSEPPSPVSFDGVIDPTENRVPHFAVLDHRLNVVAVFLVEVLRHNPGRDAGEAMPSQ